MKLLVTVPANVTLTPKDSYTVEIQSMQGDADGYTNFKLGPFKRGENDLNLQSLLETLNRMEKHRSKRDYEDVLGFQQWFGEVGSLESLQEYYPELLSKYGEETHLALIQLSKGMHYEEEWPRDAMSGYELPERLTKYEVFYFSPEGTKYIVEIDWEGLNS